MKQMAPQLTLPSSDIFLLIWFNTFLYGRPVAISAGDKIPISSDVLFTLTAPEIPKYQNNAHLWVLKK